MSVSVFVVDDEADILEVVRAMLEDGGYTVETFTNGRAAIEWMHTRMPEVLLLDYKMPSGNGDEVVRELERWHLRDLAVILFAARHITRDIKELVRADAYLEKPFEIDELLRLIERCRAERQALTKERNS